MIVQVHIMSIPNEILDFFGVDAGQTLLIKGLPGTGKTTLALEILNAICEKNNGLYISTRVDPNRVYSIFPWIRESIPPKNVVNATQAKLLKSLEGFTPESSDYGVVMDIFKVFFDEAEEMDNPMIVIDSWDAVVNYASYIIGDAQHSIEQNMCEFARDLGINLIFVSESADLMPLDYIVDGVVTMENFRMGGRSSSLNGSAGELSTRFGRGIRLDKLRSVEIDQRTYTCTLFGGRFQYFEPYQDHFDARIVTDVDRIPDADENHISTGIPDLDRIIGGLGYGTCNVFEVDQGVGKRYYRILTALASNSVKNGRALHLIPSIGYQLSARDIFVPSYVKILEPSGDLEDWHKTLFEHWDELREKTGRPILSISGMDAMEFAFGYKKLLNTVNKIFQGWKDTNDVCVVVVKTGQECVSMMTHIADTYFAIKELNGGLCIYGLIPRTEPYNISLDENNRIHLTPIV
jgi:archaellum biogenesis ATPase FlaH